MRKLSGVWGLCSCFVIVLFCYWKYGKATVQLSPIWHSNCSCHVIVLFFYYWRKLNGCSTVFSIAKQNYNKTRTVWESYWGQLNGFSTVFSIAKQNYNKTRTVWESYWGHVQFSPIWHSNCSFPVIVVCFVIENTVKQPFSCLQYDSQTVLVLLLLFVLLLKIR
jgi:hypothetical protein